MSRRIACPTCGARDSRLQGVVENRDPLREKAFPSISTSACRRCGLLFQNPCLSKSQMNRLYDTLEDKVTPAGAGTVTAAESAARLAALKRLAPPPARLLEVGSSDGTFLALAREAGYEVVGLDPSGVNCAKARKRHRGLEVHQAFLEDFRDARRFDVVCHFYVLEYSFTPKRFLERARALLAPGGVMLFEVPDIAAFARLPFANNLFTHQDISIYSAASLRGTLARAGFKTLGVGGRLGPGSKSYGMRAAARPGSPRVPGRDAGGARLLARYYARRAALLRRLDARVARFLKVAGGRPGPVVVFGSGENGRIVTRTRLAAEREIVFCDNNAALQGKLVDGRKVLAPREVPALAPALVIAASVDYQDDMVRQMAGLGVPRARIVKLYEGF